MVLKIDLQFVCLFKLQIWKNVIQEVFVTFLK
jgi:hypothetical protein